MQRQSSTDNGKCTQAQCTDIAAQKEFDRHIHVFIVSIEDRTVPIRPHNTAIHLFARIILWKFKLIRSFT